MQPRYILGLLVLTFASSSFAKRPTHIIEIPASTREERSRVADKGYAIEEVFSDKVYIYGSLEDLKNLKADGIEAKGDLIQQRWFQIDQNTQGRFTSYSAAMERLQALETQHPNIASLGSIGQSTEGRDLVYVRISGQSAAEAEINGTPEMIYMGCHHAREHISVEVPLLFAEYLVNNYESNEDVRRLVDSREIFILPVVNPDGHIYDYDDGLQGRWWRKNRSHNNNGSLGVDLNRNYAYKWGTGGSSTNPGSDTFMGPKPFSEPETQAVRDFLRAQTRLKLMMDYHSFSELVLYPWGYTYDPVGAKDGTDEDRQIFEKMGRQMASWNGYTPQPASDLYIASGNLFDYAYGELGIIAFTFELSPRSQFDGAFYPNPNIVPRVFEANLNPMLYLLESADNPKRVLEEPALTFSKSPAKLGVPVASFSDLRI